MDLNCIILYGVKNEIVFQDEQVIYHDSDQQQVLITFSLTIFSTFPLPYHYDAYHNDMIYLWQRKLSKRK